MDEVTIKQSLNELCDVMASMPSTGVKTGTSEGVYHAQAPAAHASAEDSLNHLRLQIKYLIFDLEATRRENRYLRRMLENRQGPKSDD